MISCRFIGVINVNCNSDLTIDLKFSNPTIDLKFSRADYSLKYSNETKMQLLKELPFYGHVNNSDFIYSSSYNPTHPFNIISNYFYDHYYNVKFVPTLFTFSARSLYEDGGQTYKTSFKNTIYLDSFYDSYMDVQEGVECYPEYLPLYKVSIISHANVYIKMPYCTFPTSLSYLDNLISGDSIDFYQPCCYLFMYKELISKLPIRVPDISENVSFNTVPPCTCYHNTHPFVECDYPIAHFGKLRDVWPLPLKKMRQIIRKEKLKEDHLGFMHPELRRPIRKGDFELSLERQFKERNYQEMVNYLQENPYIEPTMSITKLGKGLAATAYGFWNAATWNGDEDDLESFVLSALIEIAELGLNFNITHLILKIAKLINKFFRNIIPYDITDTITSMYHKVLNKIVPKQVNTGANNEIEATSLISNLADYEHSIPAIASALASIVVVIGTIICFKEVRMTKKTQSLVESVATTMFCATKIKNGAEALSTILSNLKNYVTDATFNLIASDENTILVQLISSSDVADVDGCEKRKLFTYLDYILDPRNMETLKTNNEWRKNLFFSSRVLSDIQSKIANKVVNLPTVTINYIKSMHSEVYKISKAILKNADSSNVQRFQPFWINLVGSSGTGKSNFMSILSTCMIELMKKDTEVDFELPGDENMYHFTNFADKYLTGYTGQYFCMIDDVFQDNNMPDISSGLKVINWISSIPHYTNQASLEDKGIPFTSKILISSSNDPTLHNRKEVVSIEALKNRIRLQFQIEPDLTYNLNNPADIERWKRKDPFGWFKTPVKISLYRNNKAHYINFEPQDIITVCYKEFKQWFIKEKQIEQLRKPTPAMINSLVERCKEVKEYQGLNGEYVRLNNDYPFIQPTSSIRCMLYMTPTIMKLQHSEIEQYNCDCQYHYDLNMAYSVYCSPFENMIPPINSIAEFDRRRTDRPLEFRTLRSDFESAWNRVKDKFKQLCTTRTGRLAIMFTTALATWGGVKYLTRNRILPTAAKYQISKPTRTKQLKTIIPTSSEQAEDFLNTNVNKSSYDLIYSSIMRRGLVVKIINESSGQRITNCGFRVAGTNIITNHHFMKTFKENDKFKIIYNDLTGSNKEIQQSFHLSKLVRVQETDLVIYNCDNLLPQAKNMIKHFPSEEEVVEYAKCVVVTAQPMPHIYSNVVATPVKHKAVYTSGEDSYNVLNSYLTNCPVEPGMSGSILVNVSKSHKSKILGIQTSKNTRGEGCGYFKPITQKQINDALMKFEDILVEDNLDETIESTCLIEDKRCPPNLAGNCLKYVGTVPSAKCVKMSAKSMIIPSLIQDENLTQEPSVLSNFDERMDDEFYGLNVMYRSFAGFGDEIGVVDRTVLDSVTKQMAVEYNVVMDVQGIPRRVLNEFETINGIPGILNRVNMKSSPGLPYVLERKETTKGGKWEWFDEINPPEGYGKAYQMGTQLVSGVEQAEQAMKENKIPNFIAYCCLKDETRPLEKIKNGKTRTFICLPMHYNILIRKYFGAFVATQHQKAGVIASCVGIDPATQWTLIYDKLKEKGGAWEDFDYANWDQHLHPELTMKMVDIVNKWYNDEHSKIRKILVYGLIHTPILVKDKLFYKTTGQCSGCAITAELNCIVHDLLMAYVWFKMHADKGMITSLDDYRNAVSTVVYGDDIILAKDQSIDFEFSGTTIQPYMQQLGMNITPGDKISTEFKLKSPSEVLFLKRGFQVEGDVVKAPLRSDIIENIVQWIHKSDNPLEATKVNCETAIQESYMHSDTYFHELLENLNSRIISFNRKNIGKISPITLSYEYFDRKYSDSEYVCTGLGNLTPSACMYEAE